MSNTSQPDTLTPARKNFDSRSKDTIAQNVINSFEIDGNRLSKNGIAKILDGKIIHIALTEKRGKRTEDEMYSHVIEVTTINGTYYLNAVDLTRFMGRLDDLTPQV